MTCLTLVEFIGLGDNLSVPIEYTSISSQKIMTPSSRYRKQSVIYYGERKLLTFDTYVRKAYVPNGKERVMVITKGVEYRPDLVSNDFYGFPDNWWRILEGNKMTDIWEFQAGRTIMLPELTI
jgi:hypothetical protein